MLPFAVIQKVRLTCPHCGASSTKLAAAVRKGMKARCDTCRRMYEVRVIEPVIGSAVRR